MSKLVVIGKNAETGQDVTLDLDKLMEGGIGMLANSGGGKSHLIKAICEAVHVDDLGSDALQQIIMDWEGDLVVLAEKFDYLVAQKDGKIPVDPRSAATLARKVLELNANIIIDLSDLKIPDRKLFAKNFLEALVYTPKDLWNRQCIVVLDEAHELCPEKGYGESVATNAVVDLMSLGRKRGLRGILASQRPARLNKDALTQVRNKFIGLASWEVDQKVCARELGFTTTAQQKSLEHLDHEFFAIGPAVSKTLIKIKAGRLKSRDLKAGRITDFKPATSARVAAQLEQLADLPKQAEQELRTLDDFKRKNTELQSEIYKLRSAATSQKPVIDQVAIQQAEQRGYQKAIEAVTQLMSQANLAVYRVTEELGKIYGNIDAVYKQSGDAHDKCLKVLERLGEKVISPAPIPVSIPSTSQSVTATYYNISGRDIKQGEILNKSDVSDTKPLNAGQKKILQFLALRPDRFFSKSQIGAMTGFAPESGTFGTYLSGLKSAGYIEQNGQTYKLKTLPAEIEQASFTSPMQALTDWLNKMGNGGQKRIYEKILEDPTKTWTREELAIACEFEPTSGTYGTYLSNLATLTLIEKQGNQIRLNPELLAL